MTSSANAERYKNHRFPGEIISHGVWLYYQFTLSYRDVQGLLFERGIDVTHEAVRKWCRKFEQDYANQLGPGVAKVEISHSTDFSGQVSPPRSS
jgi:transposase-like protein